MISIDGTTDIETEVCLSALFIHFALKSNTLRYQKSQIILK